MFRVCVVLFLFNFFFFCLLSTYLCVLVISVELQGAFLENTFSPFQVTICGCFVCVSFFFYLISFFSVCCQLICVYWWSALNYKAHFSRNPEPSHAGDFWTLRLISHVHILPYHDIVLHSCHNRLSKRRSLFYIAYTNYIQLSATGIANQMEYSSKRLWYQEFISLIKLI